MRFLGLGEVNEARIVGCSGESGGGGIVSMVESCGRGWLLQKELCGMLRSYVGAHYPSLGPIYWFWALFRASLCTLPPLL